MALGRQAITSRHQNGALYRAGAGQARQGVADGGGVGFATPDSDVVLLSKSALRGMIVVGSLPSQTLYPVAKGIGFDGDDRVEPDR